MLVWQTLVATPINSPLRRHASRPLSVLVRTCVAAAAFVADDFGAFDAEERRDVAEARQLASDLVGDELSVREDLEVAVGMGREQVEQLRMEERLATQNAEVGVPVRLGVVDDPVQLLERHLLRGCGHVHPAPLAAQLTARDDRDEEERREVLPAPPPALVELDRANALDAEVVDELRHDLGSGFREHALRQGEQHAQTSVFAPGGWVAAWARRRAASAFAMISSGDGSAARTSAGMSRSRLSAIRQF